MKRTTLIGIVSLAGILAAGSASAQVGLGSAATDKKKKDQVAPPSINNAKGGSDGQTLPMLLGYGLLALAVGANLVPSKRGHQD
jgi:hypothetical protein